MQSAALTTSIPVGDTFARGLIDTLLQGVDISQPSPGQILACIAAKSTTAETIFVDLYGSGIYRLVQAAASKLNLADLKGDPCDPKTSTEFIFSLAAAIGRKQGAELLDWHRTLVSLSAVLAGPAPAWGFRTQHPIWSSPSDIVILVNAILAEHKRPNGGDITPNREEDHIDPTWIAFVRWCLSEGGSDWKEQLCVLANIAEALAYSCHLDSRLKSCGPVLVEWMQHIFDLSRADSTPAATEAISSPWNHPYPRIYHLCTASRFGHPAPNLERIGAQLSVFACYSTGLTEDDDMTRNVWSSIASHPDGWNSPPLDPTSKSSTIVAQLVQVLRNDKAKASLVDFANTMAATQSGSPRAAQFFVTAAKLLAQSWCQV
ncbi:hypothetical protein [Mollivirus kamchatka]|nr:hypothetical protein [Mollivirus kamchatka]